MLLSSWLKSFRNTFRRSRSHHHRRRRLLNRRLTPIVPHFELLEDRTLLSSITVDTTTDVIDAGDGLTSLREAIIAANALAGDDTIILGSGVFTLSIAGTGESAAATGDLDITDTSGSLTIVGAGAGMTVIDANGIDRVFQVFASTVLDISGVTITGGNVVGSGGGFLNQGNLTITASAVSGNTASLRGGGIKNDANGIVSVVDSTISNNFAVNDAGGGISNFGANAVTTVINSMISGCLAILTGAI